MWLLGGAMRGGTMLGRDSAAALELLWHWTQFALEDGALAWIAAIDGMTLKSALV